MDINVTSILGFPRTLSDEDINQDLSLDIDDESISDHETKRQSLRRPTTTMSSSSAHIILIQIVAKVVRYIYTTHPNAKDEIGSYRVDYAKVIEFKNDLAKWYNELSIKATHNGSTILIVRIL